MLKAWHKMKRCPFCHAESFIFWGRYVYVVNQSGSMDVQVLEVSQQVGRSPLGYTISHTWQNTFEVNRFWSRVFEGLHLLKL